MIALLAASILAIGVALERIIALWSAGDAAKHLAQDIAKHLLEGDVVAARTAAERSRILAADVFRAGFNRLARKSGGTLEAAVERERTQLQLKMRRNLWILATIGATTPFVGLFGTVAGIMRSFKELGLDVQTGGSGGAASVMVGISEALVATAVGIVVAVEAVVLFNYLQSKLGRIQVEIRLLADEFVEILKEKAPSQSSPSTPSPASEQ